MSTLTQQKTFTACRDLVYGMDSVHADKPEAEKRRQLEELLCPSDSPANLQPIYMLCDNDNCSFTWTGKQHITQVILG